MFKKIVSLSKSELKQLLDKESSCVVLKNAVIDVFLVPCYLNDVRNGLRHALNRKLKTYDSKLEGIILGYDKIKVDLSEGRFAGRNAEVSYPVSCDCYVFQPVVGKSLEGIVNRMSEDHIGCVCHKYFNATIKRPEDTSYELWKKKKIYLNQSITFRVKDLDYTGLIPVIEGEFDDFKKYFPETYSSESGIEDGGVSKKTSKKKKDRTETAVNSTQLPSKFQENCSDSGLDFDFLSPIPTPGEPAKHLSKKRKKLLEPGSSKSPEKKKRKKTVEEVDPSELVRKLLEEKKSSVLANVPDGPAVPKKKKPKKTDDGKQLLITSLPWFTFPVGDEGLQNDDVKPWILSKEAQEYTSPEKLPPAELADKADTVKGKKKAKKSIELGEEGSTVENGTKGTKKPRKTGEKKPVTPKKTKKEEKAAKQMEFYMKKMMELAKKTNDSNLLANMLSSNLNLELKQDTT